MCTPYVLIKHSTCLIQPARLIKSLCEQPLSSSCVVPNDDKIFKILLSTPGHGQKQPKALEQKAAIQEGRYQKWLGTIEMPRIISCRLCRFSCTAQFIRLGSLSWGYSYMHKWVLCFRFSSCSWGDLLVSDFVNSHHPMLCSENLLKISEADVLFSNFYISHSVPSSSPKSCFWCICKLIIAELVHQTFCESLQSTWISEDRSQLHKGP